MSVGNNIGIAAAIIFIFIIILVMIYIMLTTPIATDVQTNIQASQLSTLNMANPLKSTISFKNKPLKTYDNVGLKYIDITGVPKLLQRPTTHYSHDSDTKLTVSSLLDGKSLKHTNKFKFSPISNGQYHIMLENGNLLSHTSNGIYFTKNGEGKPVNVFI